MAETERLPIPGGKRLRGGADKRRDRAAITIQRAFRVFFMTSKFFVLTAKKKRENLLLAGQDPYDIQQYGPDSLAARKPVEVTKYIKVG